ncbi:MAG: ATP-binding cassette domain-containing protein [Calditrichaeota bacterium]|nr:ATP-binding cassette domain-containing protein [Calditrichota bacterium]
MAVLIVDQVSKFYDHFKAVDRVSFQIEAGRMFGLLGPNGAGKTTTMRMIMNIIIPDEGRIEIFGARFQEEHKNQIGYLPEERGLYPKMKVVDHLQFLGEMKGLSAAEARRRAHHWLERFELEKWAEKKVQELSKGMQQKIQFISTIMHDPQLIIMDEPFSGLDPINTKLLKDILLELKQAGKTIILSTHLMDQAEKLCEEICLINRGRVVLQGPLSDIKQRYSHNSVQLEYAGDASFIAALPFVERINDYGNYMEIRLKDQTAPQELFQAVAQAGLQVSRFEAMETSLNDIFIEIVGGGNGHE